MISASLPSTGPELPQPPSLPMVSERTACQACMEELGKLRTRRKEKGKAQRPSGSGLKEGILAAPQALPELLSNISRLLPQYFTRTILMKYEWILTKL